MYVIFSGLLPLCRCSESIHVALEVTTIVLAVSQTGNVRVLGFVRSSLNDM